MTATVEAFQCMACGHEYQEEVESGEDRERSCPKCRSNSVRHLKAKTAVQGVPSSGPDPEAPRRSDDG